MLGSALQRTENMQQLPLGCLIGTDAQLEPVAGPCQSAELSQLNLLRKFVHTLRRYQDVVLALTGTRVTNAIAEGLNHIVKSLKNWASAFRHFHALSDMV